MKETMLKINKTKSCFFEKINEIDKSLARLTKKKREKNQINKIRNEKGVVTTDNEKIQRIIRDYYEQLYGNLDSILKSRDITLPTKVCLVKALVFLIVIYGCKSWTIKKAEH